MWTTIEGDVRTKSEIYKVTARQRINEIKCIEGEDVHIHLNKISRLHDELATMGVALTNNELTQIIIVSVPSLYQEVLSSICHTAILNNITVKPTDILQIIRKEATCRKC